MSCKSEFGLQNYFDSPNDFYLYFLINILKDFIFSFYISHSPFYHNTTGNVLFGFTIEPYSILVFLSIIRNPWVASPLDSLNWGFLMAQSTLRYIFQQTTLVTDHKGKSKSQVSNQSQWVKNNMEWSGDGVNKDK